MTSKNYASHGDRQIRIHDCNERADRIFEPRKEVKFSFYIDIQISDEQNLKLEVATLTGKYLREVIIPEIDRSVISHIRLWAGMAEEQVKLSHKNIAHEIIKAHNKLDEQHVPDTGRCLLVSPEVYQIMNRAKDIELDYCTEPGMLAKGIVAYHDGYKVVRLSASQVKNGFGFALFHPSFITTPIKLAECVMKRGPERHKLEVCIKIKYDTFILESYADGIYYQPIKKSFWQVIA